MEPRGETEVMCETSCRWLVHPALPPEGSNVTACGAGYRQVFGLTGLIALLLAVASQLHSEPVPPLRRSFLFTAAGQSRIFTGFPTR